MGIKPGNMRNLVPKKGGEITSLSQAMNYVDYRLLFTDQFARGYMNSFPERLNKFKSADAKRRISNDAENAVLSYSIVIYGLYPRMPELKKQIDSSPELKANFEMVKKWLDENGGEKIAEKMQESLGG